MWGNQQNFNGFNRGMMPPTMGAPIQRLQDIQKTALFYTVNNPAEMEAIKPDLNILYVGMNNQKKEIYVKQLSTDGNIIFETYNLAANTEKRDDINAIMEKLATIEKRLNDNERNLADVNKQANGGAITAKSAYESI